MSFSKIFRLIILVCCGAALLPFGCHSSGGGTPAVVGDDDTEIPIEDDDDDDSGGGEIPSVNDDDDDIVADDDDDDTEVFACLANQVCLIAIEEGSINLIFASGDFAEDSNVTITDIAQSEVSVGNDTFTVLAGFELTYSADPVTSPIIKITVDGGAVSVGDTLLILQQIEIGTGDYAYVPINTATVSGDGLTVTSNNDWDRTAFNDAHGADASGSYFVVATDLDYGYITGTVYQPDGAGAAGLAVYGDNPDLIGITDDNGDFTIFTPLGAQLLICSSDQTGAFGNSPVTATENVRQTNIQLQAPVSIGDGLVNGCFDQSDWTRITATGDYSQVGRLYPLPPTQGSGMLLLDTGGNAVDGKTSSLAATFYVPPDRERLVVDYLLLSNEYPDRMDALYNDYLRAIIYDPLAGRVVLTEKVLDAGLGDSATVYGGQTGWRQLSVDVGDVAGAGIPVTLSFTVADVKDAANDIAILLDNLRWADGACANPIIRADSDGDTLYDDEEIALGSDPLDDDSDDDGLADGEEVDIFGTDPAAEDGDGDGLTDEEELFVYLTDPNEADTDGDGLNDYEELVVYATDPLDSDSDNDRLDDGTEIDESTDPNSNDTDDDGLSDGDEVLTYGTDPKTGDSDSDGLDDYKELFETGTDPALWDTDSDTWSDLEEINAGSDPQDGEKYPDTCGEIVVLADMNIWKSPSAEAGIDAYSNERFLINLLEKTEAGKFLLYCGFGATTVAGYRCADIAALMNDRGWHAEYNSTRPLSLDGYRVVVLWTPFFNVTDYPEPGELAAIKEFINSGGRLIVVTDSAANYNALQNILLDNLGISEINFLPQTIGTAATATTEIGINFLNSLVSKVGFDRAGKLSVTEGGEVLLSYGGHPIAAYKGYGPQYCGAGPLPDSINLTSTGFYQDCEGGDRVFVDLSILDQDYNPVWGINSTNIVVYESINGSEWIEREESVSYDTAGESIAAALTMDYSGSMGADDIDAMEQAVVSFIDGFQYGDRSEIIKFGATIEIAQEFTDDQNLLRAAAEAPFGGGTSRTNLYGSIMTGLDQTSVQPGNRAVMAFTDGADNVSYCSAAEVVDHANDLGIPIYTIGYNIYANPDLSNPLYYLAVNTGGLYYPADAANLAEIYQQISQIVKNRYLLEWVTTAETGDEVEVLIEVSVMTATGIETFSTTFSYVRGEMNCLRTAVGTAIGGRGNGGNCGAEQAEIFLSVFNQQAEPIYGMMPVSFEVEESINGGGPIVVDETVEVYSHSLGQSISSVSLLLDYSTAMSGDEITAMQSAATAVVTTVLSDDHGQVINFAADYEIVADFTADVDALISAVQSGSSLSAGASRLYDTMYAAIAEVAAEDGYRSVVAFTNGTDSGSVHTISEVVDLAVAQRVVLYTVGLGAADQGALADLATGSDGAFFYAEFVEDLPGAFAKVADLLNNTYRLVYETDADNGQTIDATIMVTISSEDGTMLDDTESVLIGYDCYMGNVVTGAVDYSADVTAVVLTGYEVYESFDALSPLDLGYSGLLFNEFGSLLYDYQIDFGDYLDENAFAFSFSSISYCDNCSEPLDLPFDFNFYGITFNSIYVSSNGLVSFTNPFSTPGATAETLKGTGYGFILPLYGDFTGQNAYTWVLYSASQSRVTITWYDSQNVNEIGSMNTFQLKLFADGDISFYYDNIESVNQEALVGLIPPAAP